jgi:hypothetical protein
MIRLCIEWIHKTYTVLYYLDVYEHFCNVVFNSGIIPDSWLIENIKPIYENKPIKWTQRTIAQLLS